VVVPDALLGLRFNEEEESYFMLEIDRGEMPIDRYKNLHRTYFAKKILTYIWPSRLAFSPRRADAAKMKPL
jgi:hypothetical protein